MALSVIIGSIAATIFMVGAAFVIGHKDNSPRAIGLVGPLIGVCTVFWFMGSVPEWILWAVVLVSAIVFVLGLPMPDTRDDGWHYTALAIGLAGNFVAWLIVMAWNATIPIPVGVIVLLAALVLIVWWVSTRRRSAAAPQKTAN